MQTEALIRLINDIQRKKTETQNIELKAAEHGCPTKLFDTLSSFSNQDERVSKSFVGHPCSAAFSSMF